MHRQSGGFSLFLTPQVKLSIHKMAGVDKARNTRKVTDSPPVGLGRSAAKLLEQACDLCYRRRLKCDGMQPRCSQCAIYDSECTHRAASRRKRCAKAASKVSTSSSAAASQSAGTATARQQPERQPVQQTLDTNNLGSSFITQSPSFIHHRPTLSTETAMGLPSEDVVRNLVNLYLTTYNNVLPLYDDSVLSASVNRWYDVPRQRDPVSWASINIAMALAQSQSLRGDLDVAGYTVDVCLANAQSALTDVITGELAPSGVQVALGLVMLFQGGMDLRPALVLMATALRLVHVLGLQRSATYGGICPCEAAQWKRVFWIAYVLDRDLSLRCRQAPLQQDMDTDLDFPLQTLPPVDGQEPFDILYAYVELAQIQSLVYNCLFSVQASHMTEMEISEATQDMLSLIRNWKSRIPTIFSAEALLHDRSTTYPRFFCILYGRIIVCVGQLSRLSSMYFGWLESLLSHQRLAGYSLANSVSPAPPQGWDLLVTECRSFMSLFMSIQRKDAAFVW